MAVVIDTRDVGGQLQATLEQFGIENEAQFRQALTEHGTREEDFRVESTGGSDRTPCSQREVAPRVNLADEDLRRFDRDNEKRFGFLSGPGSKRWWLSKASLRRTG